MTSLQVVVVMDAVIQHLPGSPKLSGHYFDSKDDIIAAFPAKPNYATQKITCHIHIIQNSNATLCECGYTSKRIACRNHMI